MYSVTRVTSDVSLGNHLQPMTVVVIVVNSVMCTHGLVYTESRHRSGRDGTGTNGTPRPVSVVDSRSLVVSSLCRERVTNRSQLWPKSTGVLIWPENHKLFYGEKDPCFVVTLHRVFYKRERQNTGHSVVPICLGTINIVHSKKFCVSFIYSNSLLCDF